jgi:RHS repeat-associated protein
MTGFFAETPSYNSIGQLTSLSSDCLTWNGSSCTTSGYLVNPTITYNAFGDPVSDTLGNGLAESWGYDVNGRLASYSAGSMYSYSVGRWPTGQVMSANDSVNGNWNYSYDQLARLSCAWIGSACNSSATKALSWTYDQYGNRWHQNVVAGSAPQPQYNFNTNNHNTSFTYDIAGNVINDGSHTYSYDAEGRILSVDGGKEAYVYNSRGLRTNDYIGNPSGGWTSYQRLYDLNGVPDALVDAGTTTLYIGEFNGVASYGRHIGSLQPYSPGLDTLYLMADYLGTVREWISQQRAEYTSNATLPFGEGLTSGNTDNNGWEGIGGLWMDGEDNTVHTPNRNYSVTPGQWLVPDPAGLAAVDWTNPQTWNRYAYVMNNPLSFTDPTGLACWPFEKYVLGTCAGFMDNGVNFGANWNEFDLFNIRVYGPAWIPFPLNQAGPSFAFDGGYATTQLTDGYYLGWGVIGNGFDLFGSLGAANNGPSWTGTFLRSLLKGPSTGPGSCVGLFTDTVTAPLKQIQSAMKQYVPLIVGAMQAGPSGAAMYMQQLNNMVASGAAEADPQVAAVVTTAGATAAAAAPYASAAAPYAGAGGADLVLAYGLGTELKAGFNGQCRW